LEGEEGLDLAEEASHVVAGDFGGIDDEEVEGAGTDENGAGESLRKEVEGDDRAGGVGEGGGDACEDADGGGFEHRRLIGRGGVFGTPLSVPVEGDEEDGFEADLEVDQGFGEGAE